MKTAELGLWIFLSATFVGGSVLFAAHYGFGAFLMICSFLVALKAVAA